MRCHIGVRLAIAGLFILAVAPAGAAAGTVRQEQALTRPEPLTQPTRVAVGLYLLDVMVIEDAAQTVTVDFVLWLRWQDPRLAAPAAGRRGIPLSAVWNPRIQIVNERSLEKKLLDRVEVDAEGEVTYAQRYSGTVSSAANFADFPFDRQVFQIQAIAGGYTPAEVELSIEPGRTGRSERLSIVDWAVGPLTAETRPFEYVADGRVFPSVVHSLAARRHTGYYLWKVIFPLVLVVFMSWTVFWIDPALANAQVSVAVTSILTLIAYQFVLGGFVPKLSYMTRGDRFVVGSTALVFLALVEVVATSSLARNGKLELAKKFDAAARIVFPLGFLMVLVVAFWV